MLKVGDKVSLKRAFSQTEVIEYAKLTGDNNPLHVDPEFAAESSFGRPIVHGLLVSGLISALLGSKLPGEGTIYLGQELKFLAPVFVDEEIEAVVEVVDIRQDKPIVTLRTCCFNMQGEMVLEGKAVVKI